ncbi:MAG: DNA photolyase family protein [Gammaproteobacteria bacterium]|nr:DNA photolyase family protein [Gammaproteobacteria bacterium]
MASNATTIVWFKRDLRIADHKPLFEAAARGEVLPLYIVEPELWSLPDSSRRHWHFIHDSLLDLQEELKQVGLSLIIRIGDAQDVFTALLQELGKFSIFSHEETGNAWTFKRDIQIQDWCSTNNIEWLEFPTNGVVRKLKNRDHWVKIRDQRILSDIIVIPSTNQSSKVISQDLPLKSDPMFGTESIGSVQPGGRKEALRILASFLKDRGKNYMRNISKPGISARSCSRLSPHITFGTLSIREIEHATNDKMNLLEQSNDIEAGFFYRNLSAFLSRLAWHCHFIQKLEQQPSIEFKCMHPAFEGMREPHFREDYFAAWKNGTTGYPLVDACMRSLHQNGWLTFRMRAMLVSFASYHLWLDWRKTAPFLAQLFTDYEPGIHYSQFQMQSGVTGINTIRIYNPIKQSLDQDVNGKFIRRYIPELKDVPDLFIHEPWLMSEQVKNYPPPIVQHDAAIQHARAEIGKYRQHEDFKKKAKAVHQKLGSRKKRSVKKSKVDKDDTLQLSLDI